MPDAEVWYAIEFSTKGDDLWCALGVETYDSVAGTTVDYEKIPKHTKESFDFRVVRKTLTVDVMFEERS